jgi:BirA family biotin operon repressor/biotin-[acetyl-CoA-carboxylase] ligase
VGIGLNVNGDSDSFSVELQKIATSLFIETGREHDIFSIFVAVRGRLLRLLSQGVNDGFKAIMEAWQKRDMLQGKWMNWVTPTGKVIHGKSLGIDSNGVLLIEDRVGERYEVLSGDLRMGGRSPDQGIKTENDY